MQKPVDGLNRTSKSAMRPPTSTLAPKQAMVLGASRINPNPPMSYSSPSGPALEIHIPTYTFEVAARTRCQCLRNRMLAYRHATDENKNEDDSAGLFGTLHLLYLFSALCEVVEEMPWKEYRGEDAVPV